jgi:hypothetical protein
MIPNIFSASISAEALYTAIFQWLCSLTLISHHLCSVPVQRRFGAGVDHLTKVDISLSVFFLSVYARSTALRIVIFVCGINLVLMRAMTGVVLFDLKGAKNVRKHCEGRISGLGPKGSQRASLSGMLSDKVPTGAGD